MSRLAMNNPELNEQELNDLALLTSVVKGYEGKHRYECRSCGDEMWLDDTDHEQRQANKASGRGFTIPKCGLCWV